MILVYVCMYVQYDPVEVGRNPQRYILYIHESSGEPTYIVLWLWCDKCIVYLLTCAPNMGMEFVLMAW
jgi:hypothetical protein